jgi:GNAT superfamily N-acetyltransferase
MCIVSPDRHWDPGKPRAQDVTIEVLLQDSATYRLTLIAYARRPAEGGGRVLGWVAVARASNRPGYADVVEHSVYVHPAARGQGVGPALLAAARLGAGQRLTSGEQPVVAQPVAQGDDKDVESAHRGGHQPLGDTGRFR